eukprot:165236-Pyramimonas_sp.AAC.1
MSLAAMVLESWRAPLRAAAVMRLSALGPGTAKWALRRWRGNALELKWCQAAAGWRRSRQLA